MISQEDRVLEVVKEWIMNSDIEGNEYLITKDIMVAFTAEDELQHGTCVTNCPTCGWQGRENTTAERVYLDNFMCAFCNRFQLDTSDWNMDEFLDDWLTAEDKKVFIATENFTAEDEHES